MKIFNNSLKGNGYVSNLTCLNFHANEKFNLIAKKTNYYFLTIDMLTPIYSSAVQILQNS